MFENGCLPTNNRVVKSIHVQGPDLGYLIKDCYPCADSKPRPGAVGGKERDKERKRVFKRYLDEKYIFGMLAPASPGKAVHVLGPLWVRRFQILSSRLDVGLQSVGMTLQITVFD